MKVVYGLKKMKMFRGPVVALGVFDGVHRGHKEILKAAAKKAREINGASIAVTFWPHPQKEQSLYSLEHRLRLIAELGIDICIVVNFSRHFSSINAEDFIKDVIIKKISPRYVYTGKDFRFGRRARGDFSLLKRLGKEGGFGAKGLSIIKYKGKPISSTLIRSKVRKGMIREAGFLLGRPVSILGTVVRGTALGRMLGFPTANINPHHEVIPSAGIYAVRIIMGRKKFKGACYIGRRPTLKIKKRKINVEVHILDFNKYIYGKYLEIQFVKKIRPDKKFNSLGALICQVRKDLLSAKRILS